MGKLCKSGFLLLLGLMLRGVTFAQNLNVRGCVTDEQNEPIIGVTVQTKDKSKGTVTDGVGNYVLSGVPKGSTLVFSYLGYKSKVVEVSSTLLNVALEPNNEMLDELVVIGYGIQKKSVVTTAISKVTSDELDLGHPTDVENAMKGKLSGVQIISNSGQPGAESKVRIRGIGTVNNSNPLYIVDGMPAENGINNLNPSDIESIEVLKDAASAAIYGSRGANGVILITTKQGKAGRTKVTYDFSYGFQNPAKKLDLLGSEDYQMLINEMAANSGKQPYFPIKSSVNTDWQNVVKNSNAPIVNHRLSISGGSERSTYYISLGYISQEGIYGKGYSDFSRTNLRAHFNNTLFETKERSYLNKLTVTSIFGLSRSKTKGSNIANSEVSGIMASMNMLPPTEPVYQDDPAKLEEYALTYPDYVRDDAGRAYNIIEMREIVNPLADLRVNHNQRYQPLDFNYNFAVTLDIFPGLSFKTTLGLDYTHETIRSVVPVYELNATSKNAKSKVQNDKTDSRSWQWENVLSYTKKLGEHTVGVLAGTTLSASHNEFLGGADFDLLSTEMSKAYINTATAPETDSQVWGGAGDHKLASFFGRVNYNYAERYMAEFVLRHDGSSNFDREHRFSTFPSVSLGWNITNEKFMENRPKWLSFAKLRLSWGQNGNENIGAFQYTTMMAQGKNAVFGGKVYTGMLPAGYSNRKLKWETSEQTDLGLDLRFLKDALTFTVDYYKKKTKDMLLWKPIPLYTSYNGMTVNAGTVENSGVEMDASYRFHVGKSLIGLNANASYLKNKVTNQGNDRTGIDGITGGMGGQVTYSENGRPYGFFYGYETDGIFQNWDEVKNYVDENGKMKQPNAQPGDLRFKDLDGKNGIDANDRTMIGNPIPDWTYGFSANASYKSIDVSMFFQGTIGNDIYKLYRRSNVSLGNFEHFWLGRWHGEGTSNTVPRIVEGDNNNYQISDFFVQDGSYLRLKVAQIGYTLPTTLTRRWGINKLRFYVQGDNLFTITGYDGYDPEVGTRNGLDSGTYPSARTVSFGVNLTF